MKGKLQNDISDLPVLSKYRYENIFRVFETTKAETDVYYFYNIINAVKLPTSIDESLIGYKNITTKIAWTSLSYKLYGTINLWWLIILLNRQAANIFYAEAGKTYKYFLPEYIDTILTSIKDQVQ